MWPMPTAFLGREALTAALVDHLRQQPLLAVVGASGSGKSSLVRAEQNGCSTSVLALLYP